MKDKIIEINGSYLESGGQILRTSIALSVITGKACRVFNIRKGRPRPGLALQHLLGIQALAKLSNGKLEGAQIGSEEIKFYPGILDRSQSFLELKIETAGSITLLLQALIPPTLFLQNPLEITFKGGATDTFFSPTIDYLRYVFLKILEKLGPKIEIAILRRGFYPEGGAKVKVKIYPSKLKALKLTERGKLEKILVISGASKFLESRKVAERQVAGVREILGKLKLPLEEKIEYYDTQCPGSQVCILAEFENTIIGADNLGKLGKRAEDIGKETALELLKEAKSEACLDKHLADQILPYLALAQGKSKVKVSQITNHCKTNIWVIEKFLKGKFEIKEKTITWNPEN